MIFPFFSGGKWGKVFSLLVVVVAVVVYELDRHGDNKSGIGVVTTYRTATTSNASHNVVPATSTVAQETSLPVTGGTRSCSLFLSGGSAVVTFLAVGHQIRPACQQWVTQANRSNGQLWTLKHQNGQSATANLNLCALQNKNGWEYFEVSAGADGTSTARQGACKGMIATGDWHKSTLDALAAATQSN